MMKQLLQLYFFFIISYLCALHVQAQDLSGSWQGMNYAPGSATSAYWPTLMTINQNGNIITGECLEEAAGYKDRFVVWDIANGSVQNNTGKINLDIVKTKYLPGVILCLGTLTFTYYPDEEKILGTIIYTNCSFKGNFELYRIKLKSKDAFCKGEKSELVVTGKNVRWYADPQKNNLLHTGNSYDPKLTQTDTFYVTQTYYDVETPTVAFIITINETKIKSSQVTHANCNKDNGVISVTAQGQAPLTYNLNNSGYESRSEFTNLYPRDYQLVLKDSNGCTDSLFVTIEKKSMPTFLTVTSDKIECGKTTGQISFLAQGGHGSFVYALDNQPFQAVNVFTDLKAGTYILKARDSVGCEIMMSTEISEENNSSVLTTIETSDASCNLDNGSLTVSTINVNGTISYSLDGENYVLSNQFSDLKPGTYKVNVKDQYGCLTSQDAIIHKLPAPVITQISKNDAACGASDGTISINAIGIKPFQYSVDQINFVPFSEITGLSTGVFIVSVKDSTGCQVSKQVSIADQCQEAVFIPMAFSPNQDKQNELMVLKFSFNTVKIKHFKLFNRWGTVITSEEKVVESGHALWNGSYKGAQALPGTYPYELIIEFENGRIQIIRNTIQLVR